MSVTHRFETTVGIIGINPHVVVPDPVVAALLAEAGKRALPMPVEAFLNEKRFLANVVRYAGAPRLYLDGIVRKEAGVGVGDAVRIALSFDPMPRVRPVPPALAEALAANAEAMARWGSLAPSHRKEYIAYIDQLKNPESVARAVERAIAQLVSGKLPYR